MEDSKLTPSEKAAFSFGFLTGAVLMFIISLLFLMSGLLLYIFRC